MGKGEAFVLVEMWEGEGRREERRGVYLYRCADSLEYVRIVVIGLFCLLGGFNGKVSLC